MQAFKNKFISIYFGGQQESISLDEIKNQQHTQSLRNIAQQLHVDHIAFLHQNHGSQGMQVEAEGCESYVFNPVGDYLVTNNKEYGIGVVTADCLPIVLYDPVHHASGIVHAGWKGLVAGVVQAAVQDMVEKFKSCPTTLEVYVGPAAGSCCYEVQQDFVDNFEKYGNEQLFFTKKGSRTYFDSRAFVIVLARSLGIDEEKIYTRYNVCTICNLSFCSYRREKEKARRQITMVCLH